jgi:hypothetical protein
MLYNINKKKWWVHPMSESTPDLINICGPRESGMLYIKYQSDFDEDR